MANALSNIISYPHLIAAYSAKGKTNEDSDKDILKDLTGHGHDIVLHNVAFAGMSGYGGYAQDYSKYIAFVEKRYNKLVLKGGSWQGGVNISIYNNVEYKIKVSGSNGNYISIMFVNIATSHYSITLKEGINVVPKISDDIINICTGVYFNCNSIPSDSQVTIEQLPLYEDALVFDGVDDYGICENMPILTDFTVIYKRIHLDNRFTYSISKSIRPNEFGAFGMEAIPKSDDGYLYLYGARNTVGMAPELISYLTPTSYNGIKVIRGSSTDSNMLCIGTVRPNYNAYWDGVFYSAYLFDKSLDEQEIKSFIRKYIDADYLLPSEIPSPDCYYDFSLGSNEDENKQTVVDQSGNGNDAKIYNCAFNTEGSGYKDGALYLDDVDDYIAFEAFDRGFKTVFMVCSYNGGDTALYEQRLIDNNGCFSIETHDTQRTTKNIYPIYLNDLNNKPNSLPTQKQMLLFTVNKDVNIDNSSQPMIGYGIKNWTHANMSIYKFLGFKEELNEEQIKYVINKYNLLDRVDQI